MQTTLYMLTETSEFMMSFVLVTEKNNCIVIDGGRPLDMPLLKEYVAGRHISAWILTHAHGDHISGFVDEMEKNGCADFDIEKIYYNFPNYDALIGKRDVKQIALVSVLVPLAMWLVFYKLLTVNIPMGVLQPLRDLIDLI